MLQENTFKMIKTIYLKYCSDFQYGEDGERIERRRHNNRVAAQRCRQRKREYHLSLTKVRTDENIIQKGFAQMKKKFST